MRNVQQNIVIFGCSGHAKVLIDAIEYLDKYSIVGLIASGENNTKNILGYDVFIGDDYLEKLRHKFPDLCGIIAVGDSLVREKIVKLVHSRFPSFPFTTIIHPNANVSKHALVHKGTFIATGAIVGPGSTIGEHVIVNTNASVDHDCNLDDFSFVGPNATLAGNVNIGKRAFIGMGANISHGVSVGLSGKVGGGALVLHHVPDETLVVGVPAIEKKLENNS